MNGPDQNPKLDGVPPKISNKFTVAPVGLLFSHKVIASLIPASNNSFIVTVTIAVSETHATLLDKVYV